MRKLHSNRMMVISNLQEISNIKNSEACRFFIICKMSTNSCSNPLFSVPIANSNHKLRTKFKMEL